MCMRVCACVSSVQDKNRRARRGPAERRCSRDFAIAVNPEGADPCKGHLWLPREGLDVELHDEACPDAALARGLRGDAVRVLRIWVCGLDMVVDAGRRD